MSLRLWRVCLLLFGSGACALVYQITWFRELRLIFGSSTSASSAVLAVFMGGLGMGGFVLGKRADRTKNPLQLYAHLEIGVAITAAITPLLVLAAQAVYLGLGGASTLGNVVATILRLLLSVIVLGPSTFLMGGTLPAAARAIEQSTDLSRHRVAALYGVNTMGAVVGAVAANFLFLEVFGIRLTLWMACLINVLVGLFARAIARGAKADDPDPDPKPETKADADADADAASATATPDVATELRWFPPLAAGVAGGAFMLMELVWYRMLSPLLGGSSYTFGLILAVALFGIGVGGVAYTRMRSPSTLSLFGLTCALEALALILPYALGDRLALLALFLRPFARLSFGSSLLVWVTIAGIVIFPAAVVSGFQFPSIIGLYGRGKHAIGRDVGHAYLANTIGAILGALAGGFGLLPLLSAPGCWILVVVLLVATAILAVGLRLREARLRSVLVGAIGALAIAALFAKGPTAAWRHSGIGAGRADNIVVNSHTDVEGAGVEAFVKRQRSGIAWEEDGLESTVALGNSAGYVFIVNGKSDGHTTSDAPTQVMSGLLAGLLHPNPKSSLVVGLGTGSTAGWLGQIPTMERIDVVELEPAILRVAKDCALVNRDVLKNPKVHIQLGDAREVLRTSRQRYDIIFSEPSNPYRAGISSLYTVEYYRASTNLLNEGGLFVQWLQAYEVDAWAVGTVLTTMHEVFRTVSVWETMAGDLLLIASAAPNAEVDVDRLRARVTQEPYATALPNVWRTSTAEGVLSHHIASPVLTDLFVEHRLGAINTDDQNLLEFAFARGMGSKRMVDDDLSKLGTRLRLERPHVKGTLDEALFVEERLIRSSTFGSEPTDPWIRPLSAIFRRVASDPPALTLAAWRRLERGAPRTYGENETVARLAAHSNDPETEQFLARLSSKSQQEILRAQAAFVGKDRAKATESLIRGFILLRQDPWLPPAEIELAFHLSLRLGEDPNAARQIHAALGQPFAVAIGETTRLTNRVLLARTMGDFELCRAAINDLGIPPMKRDVLLARADCLKRVNDPRALEAEEEALALLQRSRVIGESIPSPPASGRPPPPPPSALSGRPPKDDDDGLLDPPPISDAAAAGSPPDAQSSPPKDAGATRDAAASDGGIPR